MTASLFCPICADWGTPQLVDDLIQHMVEHHGVSREFAERQVSGPPIYHGEA